MRLYLAGLEGYLAESKYHIDIPSNSYILTSFYYVKDKVIKEIIDSVGIDNILLDSGAFTFRTKGIKGEDIDSYVNRYIDFINKWDIKYFFEMDIDMTEEELAKVKEYRKRIEDATGKKCIPVWHKTRGVNEWKDLCSNYDYIAIGGITSALDDKYTEIIKKLVKYANQHNVKVHGLGYNRKDFLDFFDGQSAMELVLSNTPRVLIASFIAYLAGSFTNLKIMKYMKGIHGESKLALRCIVSTLFGEGIDALMFITLAFIGTMPLISLLNMAICQAIFKTLYECICYPFTDIIINKIKKVNK